MARIRGAIIGVGDCASALVQGVANYRAANDNDVGLMHGSVGEALIGPSTFFCKHPPVQFADDEALRPTEAFVEPEVQVAAQ